MWGHNYLANQALTCKPQDKRKLGRPKIIWGREPLHELEDDKISSLINSKNRISVGLIMT